MPIDLSQFEQLKTSGDLPSPKGVALAIMRLTQHDDVSMAELARVIRTDPAFVGRLIKAANGVIGFGRRPIASVQDALTVLGLPAVRAMALGFSLLTNYRAGACETFDYGRFWSVSLAMAVTSQALALRTRVAAADESYCLGLLARVGELALATLHPQEYSKLIEQNGRDGPLAMMQAERRAFAMSHAELGSAMLADWGLPKLFTDAVFQYEDPATIAAPEGSREYVITQSLATSRQLGELCVANEAQRPMHMKRLLIQGSRLSFDEPQMVTLCDHVAGEWVEWGALLNIHAQKMPPFTHISQASQAEEEAPADADSLPEGLGLDAVEVPAVMHVETVAKDDAQARAALRAAGPLEQPAGSRLRVLVAEHDEGVRRQVMHVLLEAGFDVAEARDGHLAAEAALDFQPDILVVDWALPGMSGEELVRTLRQTRIGRHIYVLATAERADETAQVAALEAGVDDLLGRPISAKLLIARIRAGQRVSALQREIENDREEIRHFAAELAVTNRRLQEVALLDALTGFPNRRFIAERLQQEWSASTRTQRPISCLVIDVDQFRKVNDTYGNEVGDSVLRQISVAMRQAIRSQDIIARSGGDEFLVVCPDTPLEAAVACGERVRQAVERAEIVSGMLHVQVTLSVGAASRDGHVGDADTLVRRSEQSLRLAKDGGRNRVAASQLRSEAQRA
ncbi:MAG: HDOD domain-containing protein [Moraxellaceae bacterium]|nr:HDOD domain-containing protein [Moraxellaceae bacterium]